MTLLDGGDRNEVNMAGDEYGSSYITGGGLLTIDTVDVWHAVTGFGNELVNGIAFNAGSTGAITAYAGPNGGQVTVTSNGHGLSEGDIIARFYLFDPTPRRLSIHTPREIYILPRININMDCEICIGNCITPPE